MDQNRSIFKEYYSTEEFYDKYQISKDDAIDVVIPIIHTNELWEANLYSIYREVSVNRLIISDGGCKDNSLEIVRRFPRVEILDHQRYSTLGYCLKELILSVQTEWFIYLHSDVYLPKGWYLAMKKYQNTYDWFGCPQQITVMVEYHNADKLHGETRPYAGSQMGLKKAFLDGIQSIDDDFVYRQEDYVLANIVEKNGYKHGRIEDTFHYHQVMHKESIWSRKLKKVHVEVEWSDAEKVRAATMQVNGIVKYLSPSPILVKEVISNIVVLKKFNAFRKNEFFQWVGETNPIWLKSINSYKINLCFFYVQYVTPSGGFLKNILGKLL